MRSPWCFTRAHTGASIAFYWRARVDLLQVCLAVDDPVTERYLYLCAQVAANKSIKVGAGAGQKRSTGRSPFGKSTAVFAQLQEAQAQGQAGQKPRAPPADKVPRAAAAFKL